VVGMSFPADFEEKALHEVAESLRAFVAKHVPEELSAHCHVGHGTIYSEIIACADKLRCDLIVLASHRPEMRDYL
ncbi:MAG: universal stress protein, partial [Gammaproteobacteria bacterium]|nr:universal stress protein [Gammaproteobacteria bacterium]NIT63453.1 universal stress protein [Gammaproteobacteria bacterium]NIV20385.1 universal stress protein [Gammaproteobacteria bacterium]NIY32033.1 universal stress protein [Gammaproteobacteria bacterium]